MFLSRGDRDLGVAYQTHPGNQASSRGPDVGIMRCFLAHGTKLQSSPTLPRIRTRVRQQGHSLRRGSLSSAGTPSAVSPAPTPVLLPGGSHGSNLPFELRGRAGDCSRVTAGQNRPHIGLYPGPNVPLQVRGAARENGVGNACPKLYSPNEGIDNMQMWASV